MKPTTLLLITLFSALIVLSNCDSNLMKRKKNDVKAENGTATPVNTEVKETEKLNPPVEKTTKSEENNRVKNVETKEVKTEVKTEVKPEAKPEVVTQVSSEVNTENKPEVKSEVKTDETVVENANGRRKLRRRPEPTTAGNTGTEGAKNPDTNSSQTKPNGETVVEGKKTEKKSEKKEATTGAEVKKESKSKNEKKSKTKPEEGVKVEEVPAKVEKNEKTTGK